MILKEDKNNEYTKQLTKPSNRLIKQRFALKNFRKDPEVHCAVKKVKDKWAVFIREIGNG